MKTKQVTFGRTVSKNYRGHATRIDQSTARTTRKGSHHMKRKKKIDGRTAEARSAAREAKRKNLESSLASEYIRGMRAAYDLAAHELAHEVLLSSHPSGPLSALARLGAKTRKALDTKRAEIA